MNVHNQKLYAHMDDAMWNELRMAMHNLGEKAPQWRTKDIENGYLTEWDEEWYYHFRKGGYRTIESLEIRVSNKDMRDLVRKALIRIHVPGLVTEDGFIVIGYTRNDGPVEYIKDL